MNHTEIITITAATVSGAYSLILSYKYFKLKTALQDQMNISKMWQKSSESAFMMAQKQQSRKQTTKENTPAAAESQQGKFSLSPRREAGLVAASL
jgi:predicted S18 family serine protease